MFSRLKNFFHQESPNDQLEVSVTLDEQIHRLFSDLRKKVKVYDTDSDLESKIQSFKKLSGKKKLKSLPSIFLEIEDFLNQQNGNEPNTKLELRFWVKEKYPELQEIAGFNLIFLDESIQKIVISKLYLKDVLEKAKSLLGEFQDPFLTDAEKRLRDPFEDISLITNLESASLLNDLFKYSLLLQRKLKDSLGENAMLNIYNKVFNKYFACYHLLDSFTITVNLLPEELLVRENANLPSKGQLHKLLKNQISSLEDINRKLSEEILERKATQKELEKNKNLYSAVLHNSLDSNIIFSSAGQILRTNKKANQLFNISENPNQNFFDLLPKYFVENFKNDIDNLKINELDKLEDKSYEFEVKKTKGTKYYSLKLSPVFIDNGVVYFSVISDITKAKTSLKLIKDAKEIAEKSAKAKTVFLSNMSHEIRTPLNAILGFSNLFTKENFEGHLKDFENIEGIKFSAENLLMIVDDILDFSKIEAGKLNIQKVDFNLKEIIKNIQTGFQTKANKKGLVFNVELDPEIPKFVIGDQYRLSQILNNLLSNAIKFTASGYVKLKVSLASNQNDTVIISFEVEDSGCGIKTGESSNIFESFYQITSPTGDKPQGTGLGLTITNQLVELLGGKLILESTEKVGSKFQFQLNYELSRLSSSDSNTPTKIASSENLLSNKSILVAEDNKLNQLFISKLLQNWSAKVKIANNGEEALNLVQSEVFDLILMDIHMPIMDGLTATQKIRELGKHFISIPIVACSADVFPESRQSAAEAGVNYYITKPINKDALNEVLFLLTK